MCQIVSCKSVMIGSCGNTPLLLKTHGTKIYANLCGPSIVRIGDSRYGKHHSHYTAHTSRKEHPISTY